MQPAHLRILLADDNAVNRRLGAALLERSGHTVTVCENGKEAVDLSAGQIFDVVLMDVQMPEMDGIEATEAIRARDAGSDGHTPILAMTALAGGEDLDRCLKAGMDGSVSKPIRPEELLGYAPRQDGAAPAPRPPGKAMDLDGALSHVGGDRDLLIEVGALFLENCPRMLNEIQEAVAAGDLGRLERSAHTLRGSVANFAADAAAEAALRLERSGHEGDLADAERMYRALKEEIDRVVAEIRALSEQGEE